MRIQGRYTSTLPTQTGKPCIALGRHLFKMFPSRLVSAAWQQLLHGTGCRLLLLASGLSTNADDAAAAAAGCCLLS